jgi:hypothetical protein
MEKSKEGRKHLHNKRNRARESICQYEDVARDAPLPKLCQ